MTDTICTIPFKYDLSDQVIRMAYGVHHDLWQSISFQPAGFFVSFYPCIHLHSSHYSPESVFSILQFTSCHLNTRICLAQWKCGCLVKFRLALRRWCSHLHIRIWTQPLLLQSVFPLHLWLLSSGVPHQHLSKRKIIWMWNSRPKKKHCLFTLMPFQKGLGKICLTFHLKWILRTGIKGSVNHRTTLQRSRSCDSEIKLEFKKHSQFRSKCAREISSLSTIALKSN